MQTERSTPSAPAPGNVSQGPAAARKPGAKNAAHSPDATQAPQDVFASLLAALGTDLAPAAEASALPDALQLSVQSGAPQADPGLPTAVWGVAGSVVTGGAAALSWAGLGGMGGALGAGLVAQTAQMDRAADLAEGEAKNALGLFGGKTKGVQARGTAIGVGQAPDRLQVSGAGAGAGAGAALGRWPQAGAESAQAAAPAGGGQPQVQGALPAEGQARGQPAAPEAATPLTQALQAALSESGPASAASAEVGSEVARSLPSEGGAGAAGAAGAAAAPELPAAPAAPADASAVAAEDSLAEQVAFWVNQNSQSAEMTLDRDGQPVQVRVALSGNEAHVSFRSDQVQTREALDASTAQLRELLQAQGLVLAGVTVGAGGGGGAQSGAQGQQQGAGGAEGRSAARAGRAQVLPAQGLGAAGPRPVERGPRGVDVFA